MNAEWDPSKAWIWTGWMVAGAVMAIGSFLPWAQITAPLVGTISRAGTDGQSDGWLTVAMGAGVLAAGAVGRAQPKRSTAFLGLLAALVGAAISGIDLGRASQLVGTLQTGQTSGLVAATVGPGLIVILGASAFTMLTAGALMSRSPKPPSEITYTPSQVPKQVVQRFTKRLRPADPFTETPTTLKLSLNEIDGSWLLDAWDPKTGLSTKECWTFKSKAEARAKVDDFLALYPSICQGLPPGYEAPAGEA